MGIDLACSNSPKDEGGEEGDNVVPPTAFGLVSFGTEEGGGGWRGGWC